MIVTTPHNESSGDSATDYPGGRADSSAADYSGDSADSSAAGSFHDSSAKASRLGVLAGLRTGIGYDVHALSDGRKLIIGGVDIPHSKGLEGHSDADVLTHAIADALLGALRLGDIGKLFPDTDPAYAGANSLQLLSQVASYVRSEGYEIIDVDSVIAAQEPKLSPYRERMRENLAQAMSVALGSIGVKATTTEHLGFEGRKEGISASAVCLLGRC